VWLPASLQGEPLRKYFYGLYSQAELNAFEANMFLAEDRILCIEVVAKKVRHPAVAVVLGQCMRYATSFGLQCSRLASSLHLLIPAAHTCPPAACLIPSHSPALSLDACAVLPVQGAKYRLEYIKEAVAEADAVTKLTGLMKQRRRWLNGTFFAMLYALGNMGRIWTESSHSVGRKLVLTMEFMYLLVNLIIGTWCVAWGGRQWCGEWCGGVEEGGILFWDCD
jgi:cellulose synthase/poly-beta-1,6-N-acetylglucosamine synthase-like glycosyltransferase